MTLVEVLVAIFLLSLLGTIILGVVVSALRLTRTTTEGVSSQGQLNDAVSRITRDIAAADPILWTSTTTSPAWAKNTPTSDELWVQSVQNGKCVRTRYYVDASAAKKTLDADTQRYPSADCPDPRLPDTSVTARTTTIISDLKTTDDAGVAAKVFTYFDKSNTEIAVPVSRSDVPKIARVQINVGANSANRAKGLRLLTSVVPRSMTNPLISNVPPPDCAQANLRAVSDGNAPSTPIVSWNATDNANNFTLARTAPVAATWPVTTANPSTVTDTAMRGRHGTTISYTLDIEGAGGTVQCSFDYVVPARAPLAAPVVTATVTPDTRTTPQAVPNPTVTLSWASVPEATAYTVYARRIDGNVNPWNAVVPGTWSTLGSTTSTSYTHTPGFDIAYEYKVVATSTDYTPNLSSPDSNVQKVLTHPSAVTANASATGYGTNRVTWNATADTTADGYQVWRRPTGTSAWTSMANVPGLATLAVNDPNAALGSRYDYMVTVYNDGPRGGCSTTSPYTCPSVRYYGAPSNVPTVLQFPANPVTSATGTENGNAFNPDGRNTASWTASPTATSYELWQFDSAATTPAARTARTTGLTGLSAPDTGKARGTRNFYMAVAVNATGPSPNSVNPADQAVAYQRPVAPTLSGNARSTNRFASSIADRAAGIGYNTTADAGETSGDTFCSAAGNPGDCAYQFDLNGARAATAYGEPATPRWDGAGSAWGATDAVRVTACNYGGCASTDAALDSYPGPFNITGSNYAAEIDYRIYQENTGTTYRTLEDGGRDGSLSMDFSGSAGVRPTSGYAVSFSELADDPLNASHSSTTTCTAASCISNTWLPTPGASYTTTITASATNGLTRTVSNDVQMPPSVNGFNESDRFCRDYITNDKKDGWKSVTRIKAGQYTRNPVTDAITTTYANYSRLIEAVGRVDKSGGAWGEMVAAVGVLGTDKLADSDGGWSAYWPTSVNARYWRNTDAVNDNVVRQRAAVGSSVSTDGRYIPILEDAGSVYLVRQIVDRSGLHDTSYGSWSGGGNQDVEYIPRPSLYCPSGNTSWEFIPDFISRHSQTYGVGDINPNYAAGNKWGIPG